MVPRVFVTRRIPEVGLRMLAQHPVTVDVWDDDAPPPRDVLLQRIEGAHGVLTMLTDKVDAEFLERAGPQLRVVSQFAVGTENIDKPACAARNVKVGNTPGVLSAATADVAMALLLSAARRLPEGQAMVRAGEWRPWAPTTFLGKDLDGAVLGIIGHGRVGHALAQRARAFGMRIIHTTRSAHGAPDAVSLDELLRQSDFVSLNCDLNPSTRHIINAATLALMKDTAVLINTARGGCVDQNALYDALSKRPHMYAGLDVTDPEPLPAAHPLLTLPNCQVVPHVGSATVHTRDKMAVMAAQNLIDGVLGAAVK